MLKLMQITICCTLLVSLFFGIIESRPPNVADNNQDLDNIESDVEEVRNSYYDLPAQSPYSSIPIDRLQMLIAQYRPNVLNEEVMYTLPQSIKVTGAGGKFRQGKFDSAYLRSPGWSNSMNELFRVPETKRQVRYRQCYFNPISCFKK